MKYKLSPFNILFSIAIVFAIYFALTIKGEAKGWAFAAIYLLLPYILLGLIADFIIQQFITKHLFTITVELILLIVLVFFYSWSERVKTLIIPDKHSQFIVIVYDVDGTPKLPLNKFGWRYEVRIPENCILQTSSKLSDDLPETKIKTYSGITLNTDSTEMGWVRIQNDTFVCNGKVYDYQLWMVDDTFCCGYSNKEIDSFELNLKNKFCSNKTRP